MKRIVPLPKMGAAIVKRYEDIVKQYKTKKEVKK